MVAKASCWKIRFASAMRTPATCALPAARTKSCANGSRGRSDDRGAAHRLSPIGRAQIALQYLARARHRKGFGTKLDRTRTFVSRDRGLAVQDQVIRIGHHSFAQANNGVHAFAPAGIGHPDHRAVADGGMRAERLFDFGREDILAARDDHVLEPRSEEHTSELQSLMRT